MEMEAEDDADFPGETFAKHNFSICDEDSANWYLRKQATLATEIARIKAQADAIIKPLLADSERLQSRFEAELQAWAQEQIAARGGKRKTLDLLQGSIAFRTVPASIKIVSDEEAFVYARTFHADLIQTIEKLDTSGYRAAAKAAMEETGEMIPGTEVTPARESMSLKFGK